MSQRLPRGNAPAVAAFAIESRFEQQQWIFLLPFNLSCGIESEAHGHQIGFAQTQLSRRWVKWPAPSAITQLQLFRCRTGNKINEYPHRRGGSRAGRS